MSSFELLISGEASRQVLEQSIDDQWAALAACEAIAAHPVTTGLPHWQGEDGFTRHLRIVRGWALTFRVDHSDRAVRILAIDRE
jgi:hypothetical protein